MIWETRQCELACVCSTVVYSRDLVWSAYSQSVLSSSVHTACHTARR